jgi:hypothetical protein
MGGTLSQPESTTIKLPEAGKPGPQGPAGPAGPPGDPMILLTSPQFKDALTASSFYCPDGKDYCSVPKKSIVDFDFLMNKNLDVYGKLNSNNALTIGNDLILSRADRASIYPSLTNNSLQIRSNGTGNLQLNQDNNGNILLANGGGRVGLGTSTPMTRFDMIGTSNQQGEMFKVGGVETSFYPVLIDTEPSWETGNIYEFIISRSKINLDSQGKGSLTFTTQGHNSLWGNQANFIKFAYVNSEGKRFVANILQDPTSTIVVVWLRGNTSYYFSGYGATIAGIGTTVDGISTNKGNKTVYKAQTSLSPGFDFNEFTYDSLLNISSNAANVGIGTLDPKTPLHVKGNGGLLNLEGKDHGYIQYYPRGFVGGRKSYVGVAGANDTSFYIVNEDTGNIELGSNNNICFSYKPTSTSSSKKVCISDIVNKTGL